MNTKHILFIVENSSIPNDRRVWHEAVAAKEFGYDVSVICPAWDSKEERRSIINGIHIYLHPQILEGKGRWSLLVEYLNASFWEFLLSIKIFICHPFHAIHGANPPDHIFLIAILFKLFGVKYIFDHHDITPENYVAKFSRKGMIYRILLLMEWLTFKTADLVISTNESYKKIAIERGRKKEKTIIVVRNGPYFEDVHCVSRNSSIREGFNYLVGYVGVIGQQEGIENLLEVASYIVSEKNRTDIKFMVVGSGPFLRNLIKLSQTMKLEKYVHFTGYISDRDLAEILCSSDVCVNPEFSNEFTDKSTMIKIMEYMSFGKPIVQFYTKEGEVTAGGAAIYIRENSIAKFADALVELLDDPKQRSDLGSKGKIRIKEELAWAKQKRHLKDAYQHIWTA